MKFETLDKMVKDHIRSILTSSNWDLQKTARLLKISASELEAKIEKFSLREEDL